MTTMSLFPALCQQLGVVPDRRNEAHATCPACGKEPKRGQVHFSFSENGAKCFVCGTAYSLAGLAARLDIIDLPAMPRQVRHYTPPTPRPWQDDPEALVSRYTGALDRVDQWRAYKPLSIDTIARWELGVGVLPSCACVHRRLVYPIRIAGRVVGLRGRRFACPESCPAAKVAQAAGSRMELFNMDGLRDGAEVMICENAIDAILAMQEWPELVAVAIGGAAMWDDDWTVVIAAHRPKRVTVALDNDLAGCPNFETLTRESALWRETHGAPAPFPNGPKIVHLLRSADVNAECWKWPKGSALHYDLGAWLSDADRRRIA